MNQSSIEVAQIKEIIGEHHLEVLFLKMLPFKSKKHPRHRYIIPRGDSRSIIKTECVVNVIRFAWLHKRGYYEFHGLKFYESDSSDNSENDTEEDDVVSKRHEMVII